jgi:uncharacterized protein (TIGR03435 family)
MLRRRVVSGLWVVALVVACGARLGGQTIQSVQPMAKDAHPSFEVATIKVSDPADTKHRFEVRGHRIVIENQTVQTMIEMSYGVHARQIVNAPSWAETERFDAEGLPDVEGQPNLLQFQEMVRKLLEERFGLKLRTDKREMATKSAQDLLPSVRAGGNKTSRSLQMTNVSMGDVAHQLQGALDRPVVDETGLKGRYDFNLNWLRADAVAEEEADSALPGLFTAIQEQAGLKVEPSKGEVDVLVIEHVEKPETN